MTKLRIYVASSWRNERQPEVIAALRNEDHNVYDFRAASYDPRLPPKGGFSWSDVDHRWTNKSMMPPEDYLAMLNSPLAMAGFRSDFNAMQNSDVFVLVLPCERDAHLELGWACGAAKETIILLDNPCKASLMYRMVDHISPDLPDLIAHLRD